MSESTTEAARRVREKRSHRLYVANRHRIHSELHSATETLERLEWILKNVAADPSADWDLAELAAAARAEAVELRVLLHVLRVPLPTDQPLAECPRCGGPFDPERCSLDPGGICRRPSRICCAGARVLYRRSPSGTRQTLVICDHHGRRWIQS